MKIYEIFSNICSDKELESMGDIILAIIEIYKKLLKNHCEKLNNNESIKKIMLILNKDYY